MKHSLLLLFVTLLAATPAPNDSSGSHDMMTQHGAHVMPFDQAASRHLFAPDDRGGFVMVMVGNHDQNQIALVRSHLRREAALFAAGNYQDPAYIHGARMPGLAAMSAGAARIAVSYAEVPYGAEIAFRAGDASLVKAIHQWLAAQDADHNSGARRHCDLM